VKLDPQAQELLSKVEMLGLPKVGSVPIEDIRTTHNALAKRLAGPGEKVSHTMNCVIPGPGGGVAIRIYSPERDKPLPMMVFFHGGGWVYGSVDVLDATCRSLANAAGYVVISVEYRLAPEHAFPAALNDCYAVTVWAATHAVDIGGDDRFLVVGGESAGGNLAAAVALLCRDRGGPQLVHQILVYPILDNDFSRASYRINSPKYSPTVEEMKYLWDQYLGDPSNRVSPYAAPMKAECLDGLPPALVITAGFDPLRDEGEAYANRLQADGTPVRLTRYSDQAHGFLTSSAIDRHREAIEEIAATLRAAAC